MTGIYQITSPSGRIYIGQSVNVDLRIRNYKSNPDKSKSQTRLYNSFKKYGVDNHIFQILIECDAEELNDYERYYQDLYNVLDLKSGLNCKLTRTSDRCGKMSDDSKKKLRKAFKGKKLSKEHCKKISAALRRRDPKIYESVSRAHKGRVLSEEHKNKLLLASKGRKPSKEAIEKARQKNLGRKRTQETKDKISKANKGKKISKETIEKIKAAKLSNPNYKYVGKKISEGKKQIIIDINTGVFYIGIKDLAAHLGMNRNTLSKKIKKGNMQYKILKQ